MRSTLIAGNWKMNGDKASIAELLAALLAKQDEMKVEYAVMPPFVYLSQVQAALTGSKIKWGAQNVCAEPNGALTGEVSINMLRDFGCEYVILGHSERRHLFGETNEMVAEKCRSVLLAGLTPIVCVGETLAEREAEKTFQIVQQQLAAVLAFEDNQAALHRVILAYEPIWAIGTGKTATPEQAQAVHAFIRAECAKVNASAADKMRILYGGSVKPENASSLLSMTDIDGALVGGASLKADSFLKIG